MIQWYPGHMATAKKALALAIPAQDVLIEVLDARAPVASSNPVITELRGDKPCVKLLAKADLADPAVTTAWLRHFERGTSGKVLAMASSTTKGSDTKSRVLALCRRLAPHRPSADEGPRRVRVMVVGVPNVGKSTLINTLAGRRVAKVGDEPAVTKSVQKVELDDGVLLSDNPGILWPKVDDERAAYRLAFAGALPDTAFDFEDVAWFAGTFLLGHYPGALLARYSLKELPPDAATLLTEIGRRRGCIRAGGVIDRHKAADHLIHDFRGGLLGRISLESPPP